MADVSAEINRITQELRELEKSLRTLVGAGDKFAAQNAAYADRIILLQRLKQEQAAYEREASKGVTNVSGGHPASIKGQSQRSSIPAPNTIKESAAQKFAREQAEAAQSLVKSNVRYAEAIAQAERLGLKVENLRRIEDRGGGIQQLLFQKNIGGVDQKFRTYVSESGKATPGLSSQFRSFGSDIARDIGQFTKWSIAVAAVYTPLQKLGELMQVMVENESKLADAAIAANIPFEKSGEIFDVVYEAANRAGEGVTGVIDAYAQAYRAAGRYNSEEERRVKSAQLLNDALILSKLSTLDQAGAIDTLTAALLQSERGLDGGQELLNKWVRVSQVANVDIATLATGVAVLGDSAETAGLDIDKLNGLVAVLAEQSISGSKEAANTAKALIGSYQSDKAEQTLNKFGFAVRKANGEVRGFLEVYGDLAKARQEGLLSEANVSEIALALGGGGVRRAKDASALINSYDRLNDIADESNQITGASNLANDSLAKKLETVQTASTKASNAFQGLAQSIGDEGGLLDTFKSLLNLVTGITTGLDKLFAVMGRSGPALAVLSTGLLALRSISPERQQAMLASLGGTTYRGGQFIPGGGRAPAGGFTSFGPGVGGYGRGILGDILQMNNRGGAILGGAAIASAGIQNLSAGKNEQAIGNVVGGVIGAAIGGALSGGIGIAAGAAIGSSIGDSFVTSVTSNGTLDDWFAGRGKQLVDTLAEGATLAPEEKTIDELFDEAFKSLGGGSKFFGGLRANLKYMESLGTNPNRENRAFNTSQAAALELLKQENPELYSQIELRRNYQARQTGTIQDPADVARAQEEIRRLQKLAEAEREKQLTRLGEGDLTPSQFNKISSNLAGFPTSAYQGVEAFGQAFQDVSDTINSTEDVYNAFLELVVYGTEEQKAQTTSYISDIQLLQSAWESWNPETKNLVLELSTGTKTFATQQDIAAALGQTQGQAAQFANSSLIASRMQRLTVPSIAGSYTESTTREDELKIIEEGQRIQQKYWQDVGKSADEIDYLIKNIESFTVYTDDAGRLFYDTVEGLNQWAYDAARKSLEEQGKLKDDKGIGFQKFDVPISTLQTLAQQSLSMGQDWQQKFNYDFKPEDQIAIDNQGIVQPLHADFKILALLLEKIVDQNQKQLDGQYNIPEGATFWVPLTAAYYRSQGDNGMGAGFDVQAFDENTGATESNTTALDLLREQLADRKTEYTEKLANEAALAAKSGKETVLTGSQVRSETMRDKLLGTSGASGAGRSLENLRGQTGGTQDTFIQSVLNDLKNGLRSLFTPVEGGRYSPGGGGRAIPSPLPYGAGVSARSASQAVNTTPVSKLDLKLSSTTNLVVDGRVLATVLKSYLASDLLRAEGSQGTISRRYII